MTKEPSIAELNGFLAAHEDLGAQQLFAEGDNIGEWRVTGLLGRGGNAEVYRVVRAVGTSRTETSVAESVGALKVLYRTDDATRTRFAQEVEHLKDNTSPSLPRFLDAGVVGRSSRARRTWTNLPTGLRFAKTQRKS